MKHLMKQCLRGMGTLPGVGEHTGTMWMVFFTLAFALVGGKSGVMGFIAGAGIALLIFGPLYLLGSYERAKLSDNIVRQKRKN